jgi:hypothetical protein
VDTQNKTSVDIEDLYKRLGEVEQLQGMAMHNATTANERSMKALNEAKELYKNGTAPLPELNITALEGKFLNYSFLSFILKNLLNYSYKSRNCFPVQQPIPIGGITY